VKKFNKGDRCFCLVNGLGSVVDIRRGEYSIIVLFDSNQEALYTDQGFSNRLDLYKSLYHANTGVLKINTADTKIPIDTLVWIYDKPFHFAGFDGHRVLVFRGGRTSFTSIGVDSHENYSFEKNNHRGNFENPPNRY